MCVALEADFAEVGLSLCFLSVFHEARCLRNLLCASQFQKRQTVNLIKHFEDTISALRTSASEIK
jgi:hypothetical protein